MNYNKYYLTLVIIQLTFISYVETFDPHIVQPVYVTEGSGIYWRLKCRLDGEIKKKKLSNCIII